MSKPHLPHSQRPAERRAAIVSGGSSGLGLVIARTLLQRGYAVTILGRDPERLQTACDQLLQHDSRGHESVRQQLHRVPTDATSAPDVHAAVDSHLQRFGRLDVLVNVVGRSDRGRVESLQPETLRDLFETNVIATLLCSQACLPALRERRGTIVNMGSLACRVAPRFLGGYVTVKHALAGMTRQMRLECLADGVHVALICPGPVAGEHAANRYAVDAESGLPESAATPGGGAQLKRLRPEAVAEAVMQCIEQRHIEIVLPGKTRLLMLIGCLSPRLADWILARKTA